MIRFYYILLLVLVLLLLLAAAAVVDTTTFIVANDENKGKGMMMMLCLFGRCLCGTLASAFIEKMSERFNRCLNLLFPSLYPTGFTSLSRGEDSPCELSRWLLASLPVIQILDRLWPLPRFVLTHWGSLSGVKRLSFTFDLSNRLWQTKNFGYTVARWLPTSLMVMAAVVKCRQYTSVFDEMAEVEIATQLLTLSWLLGLPLFLIYVLL